MEDLSDNWEDFKNQFQKKFEYFKKKIQESNAKIKSSWDEQIEKIEEAFSNLKKSKVFSFNPFDPDSWDNSENFDEPEQIIVPPTTAVVETFEELRNHNTEESALKQLNELATDLSTVEISSLTENSRYCFILCNSYTKPQYSLGVGPINDSITVAANHRRMGYSVYFLHNPKSAVFLKFLEFFLRNTTQFLTVFYSGHGANIPDKNDDELDGLDEVIVLDDDFIVDDQLARIIKDHSNGVAKVILLNDCCHSGTIWDIPTEEEKAMQFPPNILCLSAANDDQLAKQGRKGLNDQGFFTFLLFQEFRKNKAITPIEIQSKITAQLKYFQQTIVVTPTRPDLLQQPLFPQD